jgi:ACS family allantoate permease-like MFS transporter
MAINTSNHVHLVTITPADLEVIDTHQSNGEIHHLNEKIHDGDDALKILNSHYEAFTPEEERKVLRKIDWRMCSLMLLINGMQFIDKNVRQVVHLNFLCKR